ncbi:MAG: hypothetical protein RR827_00890 [Oscillospiraceae bacterium]
MVVKDVIGRNADDIAIFKAFFSKNKRIFISRFRGCENIDFRLSVYLNYHDF